MKKSMQWLLALSFGALGTTGCAAAVDETGSCEGAACEAAATTAEALIGGWASGPYTWTQGPSVTKLPNVADNVCVLTRVSGKFVGMGEAVQLTDDGTNWILQGSSQQSGVSAEAHCFRRAQFYGGGTRVSSEYTTSIFAREGCYTSVKDMYAADAFVFLTGLQGGLNGGGEWATVNQALAPDLNSILQVGACGTSSFFGGQKYGEVQAYARNFRVGAHTERLALLANRNGNRGDANDYPEYLIGGSAASDVAVLAPTSDAMCALTRISGQFAGGGESVQIRAEVKSGVEHWVLRTSKGGGSNFVQAGARCFARDQR